LRFALDRIAIPDAALRSPRIELPARSPQMSLAYENIKPLAFLATPFVGNAKKVFVIDDC
jgi:hypothetical protein